MTTPEAPTKEDIAVLAEALSADPELAGRLLKVQAAKERGNALDEKLAALAEDNSSKLDSVRQQYLLNATPKFADVDPKKALLGFGVRHAVAFKDMVVFQIAAPTAAVLRGVEEHALKNSLRPHEQNVLSWIQVIDTTPAGGRPVDLTGFNLEARLTHLRSLPDIVLQRLSASCDEMATFLTVFMETNLGN